jgi:Tfp pilus assembly protein PilF
MSNEKKLIIKKTFDLAVKNHQNNKFNVAQDLYNKILEIDPNYANAHYNLSLIYRGLGEFQKAIGCYEKVITINPNYADAHNNLGIIFKELGEIEKAKDCFEKAIEINPLNKEYMVAYGYLLLSINDNIKGYEYIKKGQGVIKFTPSYYKLI